MLEPLKKTLIEEALKEREINKSLLMKFILEVLNTFNDSNKYKDEYLFDVFKGLDGKFKMAWNNRNFDESKRITAQKKIIAGYITDPCIQRTCFEFSGRTY